MVYTKTEEQVALMKEAALLVSKTLSQVATQLKPGMTTLDIDQFCMQFVKDHNATLSFYNYHGYPHNICASVNDVVVHGFPNKIPLQEGDIVSIDLGVVLNGWHGDHAYTFIIGEVAPELLQLVNGYGVVRELVGHGLGKSLHEDPQVPNYGKRGTGLKMKENLVLAIEPMINLGTHKVFTEEDGWTVKTEDGKVSVHFEHDVCVKNKEALILSDFSIIEAAEKANSNLNSSYY